MDREQFINELAKINVFLNDNQLSQLEKYYEFLLEWNQKINLTRITEKKEVYLKHFYDSLSIVKAIDLEKQETLCDVGSGAGFPGIVLKIAYPHLKIKLIDSKNKRVIYLNEIIKQLGLKDIEAIHVRSEEYNEKFDIVTVRAVASLDKLIIWCSHLLKKDGKLIAMKANIDNELEESRKILKKYNCYISNIINFYLPLENSLRNLVIVENVK